MRRAPLIIAALLCSCAKQPPNAVLTVQDPDNVALGAVGLGVGPDLDALERKDLDGHPFPVTLALTTDRRIYEGEVWVEAYTSDGTAIGRGFSKADIHEDNPSTVLVTLAKPCDKDENCDDGVFCNGAETCRNRSCLKPAEPCGIGAFACVSAACVESMGMCTVEVDHSKCAPIVRPDGSMTPTYCDPATGCAPGKACYTEDECQDTSFCNGRERCVSGRCIGGLPPDISDADVCNVDACRDPEGAVHFPDLHSDGRPCTDASIAGDAICVSSICTLSRCGDSIVDSRTEDCEDFNSNPSDGCDHCNGTQWRASVVAGLGDAGGDPLNIALNFPGAITVDTLGDIYIAETLGGRILRVDAEAGVASVYAGTGGTGSSGDFGPAIAAQLGSPYSLAIDGKLNLFVLDFFTKAVRRIDGESGIITTVAGGGTEEPFDSMPATTVGFHDPRAIAVDGLGNLLVADFMTGEIFKINGETDVIDATFFGPSNPSSMFVDLMGYIWVVDHDNEDVQRLDAEGFADIYLDRESIRLPTAVVVDRDGRIYVAEDDPQSSWIVVGDPEATHFERYAGTGDPAVPGEESGPVPAVEARITATSMGINFAGDLIFTETNLQRVRRVTVLERMVEPVAGNGELGPSIASSAATTLPTLSAFEGLAVASDGTIYTSEQLKGLVLSIDDQSGVLGVPRGQTRDTTNREVAIDATSKIFVAREREVRRIDATGAAFAAGDGNAGTCALGTSSLGSCFNAVSGIAFDARNHLFVADRSAGHVNDINLGTNVIFDIIGGLLGPEGIDVDTNGDVYIAEKTAHRVRRWNSSSRTLDLVAGTGVAGFSGDNDQASAAQLNAPEGVALYGGALFIADTNNHRVRRVDLMTNVITTVAGTGVRGVTGDGGAATSARIDTPKRVACDPNGDLLIAHAGTLNGSIRRVSAATQRITTVAGAVDPQGDGRMFRSRLGSAAGLVKRGGSNAQPLWWIADGGTGRVREVDTQTGFVRSVAGYPAGDSGDGAFARWSQLLANPSGIAFDAANQVVYVSERDAHVIRSIDVSVDPPQIHVYAGVPGEARHRDGPLLGSRFYAPAGLTFDDSSKNLYIADAGNHCVRVIDTGSATPRVRTFAGTAAVRGYSGDGALATDALFDAPLATALGPDGSVYVADSNNHRVRRVKADGTIETILGDGEPSTSGNGSPARYFPVKSPSGLVVDRYGNLFVTSPEVIRLVASGEDGIAGGDDEVSTIFGSPPRTRFPDTVSHCLTNLALIEDQQASSAELWVLDACQGFLIRLARSFNQD